MKITKVEPLLLDRFLYVRVHTDSGLTGLGETYPQPEAESQHHCKRHRDRDQPGHHRAHPAIIAASPANRAKTLQSKG